MAILPRQGEWNHQSLLDPQETNFDSDTFVCAAAESLILNSDPTKNKMGSTQNYKNKMVATLSEPST